MGSDRYSNRVTYHAHLQRSRQQFRQLRLSLHHRSKYGIRIRFATLGFFGPNLAPAGSANFPIDEVAGVRRLELSAIAALLIALG